MFKKIKNFPRYYINENGLIKSTHNYKKDNGVFLKTQIDKYGYPYVHLRNHNIGRNLKIHRLVSETFLGECPADKQVNHKDGNKQNNNIDNLEYVTNKENVIHSIKHGLRTGVRGEKSNFSKLTLNQVDSIRKEFSKEANIIYKQLSKKYKTCRTNIYLIIKNKTWNKS